MDGQTPRKSLKRKLFRAFLGLLVLAMLTVAALPWLLSTPPATAAVVSAANKALAPSKVEIHRISLSWFGNITMTGLTLVNGSGKTLIDAKQASLDRGIIALAKNSSKLGTLTVTEAKVDIERRAMARSTWLTPSFRRARLPLPLLKNRSLPRRHPPRRK